MIRIEAVAQNGIPTKYEPFILTDKENECYWDNLKEEITSLETYEDLDECKKQQQIVNLFWNATVCYIQAKTFGAFSQGKIAFVAYDVYGDFPIWVIVADNTSYSGKLHYRCFDATDMKRRNKFAWALRRKESKLMTEKIEQELDKGLINSYDDAINFLIPDSVNSKDKEAVSSYIESIGCYFIYDENGNVNGLNVSEFCARATQAGLMFCDKDEKYKIVGLKTIKDFTEALNLSILMVQTMFGELEIKDKIK